MRRSLVLVVVAAALSSALPASAQLQPVRRDFGELEIPRVRQGVIAPTPAAGRGRVRVIVQLAEPPLSFYRRDLSAAAGRQKLDVASAPSRRYLGHLDAVQRAAVAELRREIPEAKVSRRFRIVLNGLTVSLPASKLPTLVSLPLAHRVFPSTRYTLATNVSPTLIDATQLAAATGVQGAGMKIAVVDDGIDQANRFFNPAGFEFPAGFPRGGNRWTTTKVIVARSFPGPLAGRRGRLPFDPNASFHGTHVAGIAAGVAGTEAPAGGDHPRVTGLSGVAPRAWIGNYRVFNVPTPSGFTAYAPEIVAAFEAAVADGMDVINFSGGGTETEPANDPIIETVAGVAAAGVVPVIAAGNDRDEFGFGTVGSPGTAPEAIAVAAASNTQVFGQALHVVAPGAPATLATIPLRPNGGAATPAAWEERDQPLVDVGTITGTNGAPVDRLLCGPPNNLNGGANPLPRGSLTGAVVLVSRGFCTFVSKAERARAAGAIGILFVDNRAGEANTVPIRLTIPGGMLSDLDGARLRAFMAAGGGRTTIRVGRAPERIETGRSGVVTSFSSGGPTAFGHLLKPDVTAPGGQVISATSRRFGGPFAVFDGTSMATPHVAGAAALLLERHPAWTPRQVKSALVATAGPAWGDTARSVEAPVLLAGGGLVDLLRADAPLIFTDPVSLSFGSLNVNGGARSRALLTTIADAGGGAGTWTVELQSQSATPGATLQLPGTLQVPPGGDAQLVAVARAAGDAAVGDDYGFVVLRNGDVTRRIPYYFSVTRPALERVQAVPLRALQAGDTIRGESAVNLYRFPASPFGASFVPPMDESGAERLYELRLSQPVVNAGVTVLASTPGSLIHPWLLGSRDENDVQGGAGTPVNINNLTFGYRADIGVSAIAFPLPGRYFVSVDSGREAFTGRRAPGRYVLKAWVNDVAPPLSQLLTKRVSAGRPTIVVRVADLPFGRESGVDPLSIVLAYRGVIVGAAVYDPFSAIAVIPLPDAAPALRPGKTRLTLVAGDYAEAKAVGPPNEDPLPNTLALPATLNVVRGPTVTWLAPEAGACVSRPAARLAVVAASDARVRTVRLFDGFQRLALLRAGTVGLYATDWATRREQRGRHVLRAIVTDSKGRQTLARRTVRVCKRG